MTQPTQDWRKELDKILDGIDESECDYKNAWWETSVGADFGSKKKIEIINLISQVESEAYKRGFDYAQEIIEAEAELRTARKIGQAMAEAGLNIVNLDDPEEYKREIIRIKKGK